MGPEWWFQAWEACEDLYEGRWDSMSDDARAEAVDNYILGVGDAEEQD